jgi:hypothetical protein
MDGEEILTLARLAECKRRAVLRLRAALTTFLRESSAMPINPAVQTAIDNLNAKLDAETVQIATTIQTLIDQINAGGDTTETVAALQAIATRVEALSETIQPPTP